jgi:lipopolysaccharide export system ATP-binding protein
MKMEPILRLEEIKKAYGDRKILKSLSFSIHPGEIVGLLGPNGAGKTTAFYMTIGLIKPDGGKILFESKDITDIPIHERAKMGIGYLAQEPSIFRGMSVEENIFCILQTLNLTLKEQKDRLEELLEELHLSHLRKSKAALLSGGERRRLEITRCLVTNPKLLLLDEPFANVDPITVSDLKNMIKMLKNKGISVLITDHNAKEIFSIVDRSYLIMDGKVIASGKVEDLIANPDAKNRYLGPEFSL